MGYDFNGHEFINSFCKHCGGNLFPLFITALENPLGKAGEPLCPNNFKYIVKKAVEINDKNN